MVVALPLGQGEPERGPLPGRRLEADLAPVPLDDPAADRQADAAAGDVAGAGAAAEQLEDVALLPFLDPRPVVLDDDPPPAVGLLSPDPDYGGVAPVEKGVLQEVGHGPLQQVGVPHEAHGVLDLDTGPGAPRLGSQVLHGGRREGLEADAGGLEVAVPDLGEGQEVVDGPLDVLPRGERGLQVGPRLLAEVLAGELGQVQVREDAGELVAHLLGDEAHGPVQELRLALEGRVGLPRLPGQPAALEGRHHEVPEGLQGLPVLLGEFPGLVVEDAERSHGVLVGGQERGAGVEPDPRLVDDGRVLAEPRVLLGVRDDHGAIGLGDRVGAEGLLPGSLPVVQPFLGREPLAVLPDDADGGHGGPADP